MINIERVYKTTMYIGFVILLMMIGMDLFAHVDIVWYGYLMPLGVPTVLFLATVTIALIVSHHMTKKDVT